MKKGLLILILALVCCGFVPQQKALRSDKSKINPSELYVEAIKSLFVRHDTVRAKVIAKTILQQEKNHAPALNLLARLHEEPAIKTQYAKRAYELDTTNIYYLEQYANNITDQVLAEKREFGRAAEVLKVLVSRVPSAQYYFYLAHMLCNDNRIAEAISVLDSAIVRAGRNPSLTRFRQDLLLSQGRVFEAEEDAKKSVAEAPYDADNHLALANIYARTRRDSLAIASFQSAIAVDTLNAEPIIKFYQYYENRGDKASALSLLTRLFSNESLPIDKKISAWNILIEDKEAYSRFFYMYDTFIKQLRISHPENKDVSLLYLSHLLFAREHEEALRLSKRLANSPSATEDDFLRVCLLTHALNLPDSLFHYADVATKRFPNSLDLNLTLAEIFAAHNKYDKVRQYYNAALPLTDNNKQRCGIYIQLGLVEYQSEDMKASNKAFDMALKQSKGNDTLRGKVYTVIGDIANERNEMKRCFKAYEKSLKCFYDNPSTLNNYAYNIAVEGGDLERALKMVDRALELSETNPTFLDTKAWVLYKLGRYQEAKKIMQQAISLDDSKDSTFALHYGDILHALGEEFMAKTYWRKALEQGADKEEIEKRFLPNQTNPKK